MCLAVHSMLDFRNPCGAGFEFKVDAHTQRRDDLNRAGECPIALHLADLNQPMGHRSTISLVEDVESMHIGVDGNGWKP